MQAFLYSPSPNGYHDLTTEEIYLCIVERCRDNSIREEKIIRIDFSFRRKKSRKNREEFCNQFKKKKRLHVVSIFLFLSFPITDQR